MIHPKLQTPYKYRPKEWQLDSSNVKTAHVQYWVNGILLTRIINKMTTATVKSEAKWKTQFQIMWNNTPKKLRRTISQVNNIKSQAKLYVALWT